MSAGTPTGQTGTTADGTPQLAGQKRSGLLDDGTMPKVARVTDSVELCAFDFVDERSTVCSIALSMDKIRSVPYLETLVNTAVGTAEDGLRTVHLPPGCTSAACDALVHRACTVQYTKTAIVPPDLEAAIALLQTADFLCLSELRTELTLLCKRLLTPENVATLRAATCPATEAIVAALDGNALINAMTSKEIDLIASSMRQDSSVSPAQVKVLLCWLRASARTEAEAKSILHKLQHSLPTLLWTREDPQLEFTLSPEWEHVVADLAALAVSQSSLMQPIFQCLAARAKSKTNLPITWLSDDKAAPRIISRNKSGLPHFIRVWFEPVLTVAGQLHITELTIVLQCLVSQDFMNSVRCSAIVFEMLSTLLDTRQYSFEDAVVILPCILAVHVAEFPHVHEPLIARVKHLIDACTLAEEHWPHVLTLLSSKFLRTAKLQKQDLAKLVVDLLMDAEPVGQVQIVRFMRKELLAGAWAKLIQMPLLSRLCPEAQVNVIAGLVPHLTTPDLVDVGVREHISKEIMHGEF